MDIMSGTIFLLESFSIILCLHIIFKEKNWFHIITLLLIIVYMVLFGLINIYNLNKAYSLIIYMCFIVYCRIKFKLSFFKAVAGTVLCVSIIL